MEGVAVGDVEIEIAIVIVVKEVAAPTRVLPAGDRQLGARRIIIIELAALDEQRAVRHIRDEDVGPPVPVYVAHNRTHRRNPLAVFAERQPQGRSFLDESALPSVFVVVVFHGIVGHVEVHEAVIIDVGRRSAHAASLGVMHARFLGHVGESTVAIIAVQRVGLAVIAQRTGVPRRRIEVAEFSRVVLQVVADVKIQEPVVVVVEPRRVQAPVRIAQP